ARGLRAGARGRGGGPAGRASAAPAGPPAVGRGAGGHPAGAVAAAALEERWTFNVFRSAFASAAAPAYGEWRSRTAEAPTMATGGSDPSSDPLAGLTGAAPRARGRGRPDVHQLLESLEKKQPEQAKLLTND